jgi:hypothetical protein
MIWDVPVKKREEGTSLICESCARSYVYIPDYGSFALSDIDSEMGLEIIDDVDLYDYENTQNSNDGSLGKVCFTLCILISGVPFVLFFLIMLIISLF